MSAHARAWIAHSSLTALALIAAAQTARAQGFVDPGTRLFGGVDQLESSVPLGFPFTLPGGATTTTIDISTKGRVFPGGTGNLDFTETVNEFLVGPASLSALWTDLVAEEVFFDASVPGRAVITWIDAREFGTTNAPFTMQMQLHANGEIVFAYDSRVPPMLGLIGVSPGNGAANPGVRDLSAGPFQSTGPSVVQLFTTVLGTTFDLQSTAVTFTPIGASTAYSVAPSFGLVDPDYIPASTELGRPGCDPIPIVPPPIPAVPFGIQFTPDGMGGFLVSDGGTFDNAFSNGTLLTLGDEQTSGPQPLSFPFPLPNGGPLTALRVTSNGRAIEDVPGLTHDATPTVGELLGAPGWVFAPLWVDLDPSASGQVWFHDQGTSATVTWLDVPQFNDAFGIRNTFQLRLFPDGTFEFVYPDVRLQNASVFNEVLVGTSAGNGAVNPGESDLTSLPGGSIATGGVPTFYEFFDFDTDAPDIGAQLPTLAMPDVALVALTPPAVGGNLTLEFVDSTTNAMAFGAVTYIGLADPAGLSLGLIDADLVNCSLWIDLSSVLLTLTTLPGIPVVLPIPAVPALIGAEGVSAQSLAVIPAALPVIIPTDELLLTFGI